MTFDCVYYENKKSNKTAQGKIIEEYNKTEMAGGDISYIVD